MTGQLIGTLILWLIVAVIVIAIVVYLVNWLYRRSSKEVSFVRTGLFGEKVVINGGAFVLPIIHDVTPVNMNVLRMAVTRANQDALITRDRMRVDIDAEFYVRVRPDKPSVSIAAATLGRRTLQPDQLNALLAGKFISALRSVASEMSMEEMHEQRGTYVQRVRDAAVDMMEQNGLVLESVAITDLDQTDLQYFNPSNRFDAEGLTRIIEEIEEKRKLRNDIEQESMIKIRARNLEAERQALDIERESETARLEQQREIEIRRAMQRAEVARERAARDTEAEQAQILSREEIEKAKIANERAISEARISSDREVRQREI
ncbi:MAG: SPFH domain-containing protein, partial [Beijerinckiaceae bacterium]|nr:SPFH domain-containing protein [Beijerinckiaceae bacterium]